MDRFAHDLEHQLHYQEHQTATGTSSRKFKHTINRTVNPVLRDHLQENQPESENVVRNSHVPVLGSPSVADGEPPVLHDTAVNLLGCIL